MRGKRIKKEIKNMDIERKKKKVTETKEFFKDEMKKEKITREELGHEEKNRRG